MVPFGAFVQVGDSIEGLVHISEMSAHHVELPEQVVTPGEELWVKIIDIDLERRRISLSIKQAAEGGVVAAEYQEHFGEQNYDTEGNYIGTAVDIDPETAAQAEQAWAAYYEEDGEELPAGTPMPEPTEAAGASATAEMSDVSEAPSAVDGGAVVESDPAPIADSGVGEPEADEAP